MSSDRFAREAAVIEFGLLDHLTPWETFVTAMNLRARSRSRRLGYTDQRGKARVPNPRKGTGVRRISRKQEKAEARAWLARRREG